MEETPNVDDIDLSKISVEEVMKLEFDCEDDADSFYNAYAKSLGFSIRKGYLNEGEEGIFLSREWVCSFAGFKSEKNLKREGNTRELSQNSRCGCKARFRILYDKTSKTYRVRKFEKEHNHEFVSAPCVHYLRSQRGMTSGDCDLAKGMSAVGIKKSHIYTFMASQVGGFGKVGFTYGDLCNHISRERQNEYLEGDAEGAIGYLAAMKEVEPMLFFRYHKNEEHQLTHLFWADGTCRLDYAAYGDLVIFDATYRRNVYNMPFVILIGVNNHNKTVLFGCAMMADETLQSYVWLLKTFLDAMEHKHPNAVVTDGDHAMRGAIKEVFYNSRHRLCTWHLQKNAQKNITRKGFCTRFTQCMQKKTIDEFESAWNQLMQDYNLMDNKWCEGMYEKRECWAEAYLVGVFFAGVTTTSRSEGMNSYFKGFLRTHLRLFEVVNSYHFGQAKLREASIRLQAMDESGKPVLKTGLRNLEQHASEVYTRSIFLEFRKEIDKVQLLWDTNPRDFDTYRKYYVSSYGLKDSKWEVVYAPNGSPTIKCDCNFFENLGFSCSHMVHVMKVENMIMMPPDCILSRWTKRHMSVADNIHDKFQTQPIKFGALSNACSRMCFYASHLTDGYLMATDQVSSLTKELELLYIKEMRDESGSRVVKDEMPTSSDVRDPNIVRTKGRPKHVTKIAFPKKRKCSYCKENGHNITTCPVKLAELETTSAVAQPPMETNQNMHMNEPNQYYNMHGFSFSSQATESFAPHGYSTGQPNYQAPHGYSTGQPSYQYGTHNFEFGATQHACNNSNRVDTPTYDQFE